MWYWIIMGILIAAIIVVILITVIKLMKDKKEYNNLEQGYNRRHDDYEDDYEDDYDEDDEDDYEYDEPRRQPEKKESKRRWKIILEDVDEQDQYSFIFYDSVGIGRVASSTDYDKYLSLPEDLKVSKVHCAIVRSGDKLYLKDEGSKNHTYLNGQMIKKPVVLQKEDVIRVGETRLEVIKILRETR